MGSPGLKGHRVIKETLGHKVFRVQPERMVHQVLLEQLDCKDQLESTANPAQLDCKDQLAFKDLQVPLDQLALVSLTQ
jgi:hypothetical protein